MTLIAEYNSEGCVGRCDAKCYEATGSDCNCICGGVNHGAGRQKALDNTRELAVKWIEEAKARGNVAMSDFEAPLFSALALGGE